MTVKASEDGVLLVSGDDIPKVAFALSSPTRFKILKLLKEREFMDIDELSKEVGRSKANISTQIKILEDAKLIETRYTQGKRGVKKLCSTRIKEIRIIIPSSGSDGE